jgi:hypothetical protein
MKPAPTGAKVGAIGRFIKSSWRKGMKDPSLLISLAASLVVASVFILAGIQKIRGRAAFERSLDSYAFIAPEVRRSLSILLPPLEVALGVAVLTLQYPLISATLLLVLLGAFSIASIRAFGWRGAADCGCFGATARRATTLSLLRRNLSLMVLAALPACLSAASSTVTDVAAGGLLVVCFTLLSGQVGWQSVRQSIVSDVPANSSRRQLLRGLIGMGGLGVTAVAAAVLEGGATAEAACEPCQSCADEYAFIGCSTPCCAYYFVRPRQRCSSSCYSCGSWRIETFCGIPGCGC